MTLIGTHDSAAYKFDFSVSFWDLNNKWEWLRKAARVLPCLRNKIIALSQAQTLTIRQQLECGVNVLDLRVSHANGIFYSSHTFCCGPFLDVLNQIKDYLDSPMNTEPIPLVLIISPDFANEHTMANNEAEFLEFVKAQIAPYLVAIKLIIYYKPIAIDLAPFKEFHNKNEVNNIWFNVKTVEQFTARFNETDFAKCGNNTGLGCILTPPEDNQHLYQLANITLAKYAKELRPVALALLADRVAQNKPLPLYCDFDHLDAELVEEYKKITSNSN